MHARDEDLATDEGLRSLQLAYQMKGRDLPALWLVRTEDLDDVGLSVELKPDRTLPFGKLHCETTTCPTEEQADRLARKVTVRGPLLPFVERPDLPRNGCG